MKKQKILILIDSFGYGGLQKVGYFLANGLSKNNYDIVFCSLENIESVWNLHEYVVKESLAFTKRNNKLSLLESLKSSIKVRNIIKRYNCDVVLTLGDITLFVAYIAKLTLIKKPKLIGSERNSPLKYSKKWKVIMNFLFSNCDIVVFQTVGAQRCYKKNVSKKSVVIPNPYFEMQKIPYRNKESNYIATAAARFEYKKGIDILIHAFAIISKDYPDYKLVIIGDGTLKKDYVELSKQLGINDKVFFPGKKQNVVEEIIDCKFFVLPSRLEGIPNMLMEVMGAGIPAIASDCHPGGPRMLTNNSTAGLLFKTNDYLDLAKKMKLLIEDNELRIKISKLEKERMKDFLPDKILNLWKDVIL